jgi:hypothetical protein
MEKEFVPYPEALELKQLEFDEEGLGTYSESGQVLPLKAYTSESKAILFSQAFRWFRQRPEWPIDSWIQPYLSEQPKQYEGFYWRRGETVSIGVFSTHEEAKLACLRKLIKLVK